ncbi:MAG: ketopantoate reductase family protein, partial [Gemmatimonadaceae bacterium]
MRITIAGAGAIGGWIAGLLADAGAEVSLFARGHTLAALRASGLRMRRDGVETLYRLAASDDPSALGVQDCVVAAVKGQAMPAVAPAIARMCGAGPIVVPAL